MYKHGVSFYLLKGTKMQNITGPTGYEQNYYASQPAQKRKTSELVKTVVIIVLGVLTTIFLVTTIMFAIDSHNQYMNFSDSLEVNRLFVEALDYTYDFDFESANISLEEAQVLTEDMLDRNGLETFEHIR